MLNIHEYDSRYANLFQAEKVKLNKVLNNTYLVEHIGSTAIPGVDGKGVIDIILVFQDKKGIESAVKLLCDAGYFLSADNENRNGRTFMSSTASKESGEGDIHLHLLTKDNNDYPQIILFRDYLIKHPDARRSYNDLKYELLKKVNGDRKEYTKLKDSFIKNIINLTKNEG